MNPKRVLLVSFFLLWIISFGAIAQDKYVPNPNEELYGIWINEEYAGGSGPVKVVYGADGYKAYLTSTDAEPYDVGTVQIDTKWTDSEGNVWYKNRENATSGLYEGNKALALIKLSRSAKVMELELTWPSEYDPKLYPKEINPKDRFYAIFYRAEE